jgi:hypothetical protein
VDCGILRSLYIKANGQILCDDDMGEQILLGLPDYKSTDTGIHDVLNNENFNSDSNSRSFTQTIIEISPFSFASVRVHSRLAQLDRAEASLIISPRSWRSAP